MRKLLLTTAAVAVAIGLAGCSKTPTPESASETQIAAEIDTVTGILTDNRDGRKYRTTVIGNKRWMAENLNYKPKTGKSWCYKNSADSCAKYGRLYDWNTARTVCPADWHLPDVGEWDSLGWAVGGTRGFYFKHNKKYATGTGAKLKARHGWKNSGDYSDSGGFSALPGGARNLKGNSIGAGECAFWWTAAEYDDSNARIEKIIGNDDQDCLIGDYSGTSTASSVRCVHDRRVTTVAAITDPRDGQTYKTVKMPDGKTWMAENLNYAPKTGKSWCYKNSADSCAKYGRLYGWNTAKTACPAGWKLPSKWEWENLVETAGGQNFAGTNLKSNNGWNDYNGRNGNGTDDYEFSALPGGGRHADGKFDNSGGSGYWWTATEYPDNDPDDYAYFWNIGKHGGHMIMFFHAKSTGFSVRCVADRP